jgi:hypothetical protein
MKTKQQLRDELAAKVRVELNQQALDAIDGREAVQPYEYVIADILINHLTPDMDEVVELVAEMREGVSVANIYWLNHCADPITSEESDSPFLKSLTKADALLAGLKEGV